MERKFKILKITFLALLVGLAASTVATMDPSSASQQTENTQVLNTTGQDPDLSISYGLNETFSDSNDLGVSTYLVAVFWCNPGAYVNNGQWANSGTCTVPGCSGLYTNGMTYQTCDISSYTTATQNFWLCISAPDTTDYSGYLTIYQHGGTANTHHYSHVNEDYCKSGDAIITNPFYP